MAENLALAEYTEQALGAMGRLYRQYRTSGYHRSRILTRWPAVQVMATVSAAAEHYHHGTFWPKLSDLVGVTGQAFQSEWGNAFLANLRTLRLPDFSDIEDPGARYVGPILMHSGVPTYCLRDYFGLVKERRDKDHGITPENFVAWAAGRAVEDRLFNVDKPVARFLRYGGHFAVDVTDRVFELLDVVAAGGDGEDVPLPDRFRSAALALRQQGVLARPAARRVGEVETQGPVLVLDPYGRGPLLRLPAVACDPGEQVVWTVAAGDVSERVRTQALWPGEPAPVTDVPLLSPVRSATAALLRRQDLTVTVPVVDDKDPLLVFAEDGRLLPSGLPVPGSTVWLLFPGGNDGLVTQGTARLLSHGVLPPGWAGWSLVLMDLSAATMIRAAGSERNRSVRRVTSARISLGEPIGALRSRTGAPVFATAPQIELPVGEGSEGSWSVTITNSSGVVLVGNRPVTSTTHQSAVWADVPRPLLGNYLIRVRGPWGRGAVREVAVAEGLRVESTPSWRRICPQGLVAATVDIRVPAGMGADVAAVSLAEDQVERAIAVRAHAVSMTLTVRPPHMSMSYQSTEQSTAASIRQVSLRAEDVRESPGMLTVALDAVADPVLHVLAGRRCVQELPPVGGSRDGNYRFNLAQVSDTLTAHPQARLALDESYELTIATVAPLALCSSIELVDGGLQLLDAVSIDDLVAIVYPTRAPWRGGKTLAVREGVAELPADLRDAGPLEVIVRTEDPWAPAPVPAWPTGRSDRFFVDASGWIRSDDEDESQLSRYLAGDCDFPAGDADLVHVWAIAARLPWIGLDDRFSEVSRACRETLQRDPVSSLTALIACELEVDRIPETFVRSGLAWASVSLAPSVKVAWTRASALPAAMMTGGRLADQLGRESDELADARAVCGDDIETVLAGTDPCPRAGRFDHGADIYKASDPDQRAEVRRITGLVPKGLLDRDTRVKASLDLLDRVLETSERLRTDADHALRQAVELLRAAGDQRGLDALAARRHPTRDTGWRNYPALSLGLAWIARRAARGDTAAQRWLKPQTRIWADLAHLAPELVSIDLVLAEMLAAANDAHHHKEKS